MIRIARREPKFDFRGRPGESSNPLFRGFGNQSKEEIERYDQPVLVRLNTRDASHPMKGHPGYQGNHTDYCVDIIKRVGSERISRPRLSEGS